jgi:hypothetical protein
VALYRAGPRRSPGRIGSSGRLSVTNNLVCAVEIHLNYCSNQQSYQISIGHLRGDQIYDAVADVAIEWISFPPGH